MDSCEEKLSQKDVLQLLIQLWHAISDVENLSIVKWVKGGRVFRIVNKRRFYSEVCRDICDEWTPAYFEYFMICCGFDAIPPRFVDYYHKDFLKYDYSRIERIKAKRAIMLPKAYNCHLEENSDILTFDYNDNSFDQLLDSKDESITEQTWPDPEDLPESPLTPEATDLSSDSDFGLSNFSSDMLSELDSIILPPQDSSKFTTYSKSSKGEKIVPQAVQSAISLKDLKSTLKLSLIHCLSTHSASTDFSPSPTLISPSQNHFTEEAHEINIDSSSCKLSKSLDETDSELSPLPSPESLSSPNVSPLGISKLRDFSLVFDPSDPFNLFNEAGLLGARSMASPLTRSVIPSLDSQSPCVPLDQQTNQSNVALNPQTLSNQMPSDQPIRRSMPINIPTFPITIL